MRSGAQSREGSGELALAKEDEGDLPVGLGLVFGVVRVGGDDFGPPDCTVGLVHCGRGDVTAFGVYLHAGLWRGEQVLVPLGMIWSAAVRRDHYETVTVGEVQQRNCVCFTGHTACGGE